MSGSEQVVLYNRRLRFHEELKFVSIKLTFRLSSYTLLISLLENVHTWYGKSGHHAIIIE